jgi:TonB family protein
MKPTVALIFLAALTSPPQPGSSSGAKPQVVRAVAPVYPTTAAQILVLGQVIVEVSIDEGGLVTRAHLLRTPAMLEGTAMEAARLWRFEAAPGQGERKAELVFLFDQIAAPKAESELYPAFLPPYTMEIKTKCVRHCEKLDEIRKDAFTIAPLPRRK